jgi:hypothetical protein
MKASKRRSPNTPGRAEQRAAAQRQGSARMSLYPARFAQQRQRLRRRRAAETVDNFNNGAAL